MVGSVDEIARVIRQRTDGLPVSDVWCWVDHSGLPDDLVDRHLELLCIQLRLRLVAGGGPHSLSEETAWTNGFPYENVGEFGIPYTGPRSCGGLDGAR